MIFLDPYALKIYVDGSALKNPGGPGGIAGIVEYPLSWDRPDEEIFAIGYLATTNNRMELLACIKALEYVRENSPKVQRVLIITDSQYLQKFKDLTETWKANDWKTSSGRPVENDDLWDRLLSIRRKQKIRVEIIWKKGKNSPILKAVDGAAKMAASQPWKIDRGYKPGKVGKSKLGGKVASALFSAQAQEAVIHIYRSGVTGRAGFHVRFDLYSEHEGKFMSKHLAYVSAEMSGELHRHHYYRVRFNDDPKHPIIEEIVGEVVVG